MVGYTQINFGKCTDRTSIQAGLSVGSIVRGSVLIVKIETQATSARQRYRGARSSRAGTTGSVIPTGCRRSSTRNGKWRNGTLFGLLRP